MAVQWTTDLSTRIIEIDDQHKELFRQIDSLINAWKQGRNSAETENIIRFLNDYMTFHFNAEEKYMDMFGYSSARNHKSQHAVFVKAFERLKDRYFQTGVSDQLIADTNEQIVDWFVNHVKYADKALGLFLKMKR
jgi:hemerythrin